MTCDVSGIRIHDLWRIREIDVDSTGFGSATHLMLSPSFYSIAASSGNPLLVGFASNCRIRFFFSDPDPVPALHYLQLQKTTVL